jgi:hypothetical protein
VLEIRWFVASLSILAAADFCVSAKDPFPSWVRFTLSLYADAKSHVLSVARNDLLVLQSRPPNCLHFSARVKGAYWSSSSGCNEEPSKIAALRDL